MPKFMLPNSHGARGYILSGGASSRFGSDKALVRIGTIPLLLQLVRLAQTCSSKVAVVAGVHKYADLGAGVEMIEDQWPGEGPLGGIITALTHTAATNPPAEWNLILSCDMPFLSAEWLKFLVDRAHTSYPGIDVILPRSTHGPEPLCACYRTSAAEALKNEFDRGVRKITQALKQVRTEVLDESVWKRFDSAGRLFWNMNTSADFAEAQRLWETS